MGEGEGGEGEGGEGEGERESVTDERESAAQSPTLEGGVERELATLLKTDDSREEGVGGEGVGGEGGEGRGRRKGRQEKMERGREGGRGRGREKRER